MCEVSRIEPKLQVAEEDITVYKICTPKRTLFGLRTYVISDITFFKYKLGKIYYTQLDPPKHTYDNAYISSCGFHSYKTINSYENELIVNYPQCLIKCIIPKGSHYYKYIYGPNIAVCVSDKIKLVKILNNNG